MKHFCYSQYQKRYSLSFPSTVAKTPLLTIPPLIQYVWFVPYRMLLVASLLLIPFLKVILRDLRALRGDKLFDHEGHNRILIGRVFLEAQ